LIFLSFIKAFSCSLWLLLILFSFFGLSLLLFLSFFLFPSPPLSNGFFASIGCFFFFFCSNRAFSLHPPTFLFFFLFSSEYNEHSIMASLPFFSKVDTSFINVSCVYTDLQLGPSRHQTSLLVGGGRTPLQHPPLVCHKGHFSPLLKSPRNGDADASRLLFPVTPILGKEMQFIPV